MDEYKSKEYLTEFKGFLEKYEELSPKDARKEAHEGLIRTGLTDKYGNPKKEIIEESCLEYGDSEYINKAYTKEEILKFINLIRKGMDDVDEINISTIRKKLDVINNILERVENSDDKILLSVKEIEILLFDKDTIDKIVFNALSSINADLNGVNFDYKKICDLNFSKLKNVEINLDTIVKDLTGTKLSGVKLSGSLDDFDVEYTDFSGYIGNLDLNPQNTTLKCIRKSNLAGINITGSLDNVDISGTNFEGTIGNLKVNPQKIKSTFFSYRILRDIDFNNLEIVGEYNETTNTYDDANFDGLSIWSCKFSGIRNKDKIKINYNTLVDILDYGPIKYSDLTNIEVNGTIKWNAKCIKNNLNYDNKLDTIIYFNNNYYTKENGNTSPILFFNTHTDLENRVDIPNFNLKIVDDNGNEVKTYSELQKLYNKKDVKHKTKGLRKFFK